MSEIIFVTLEEAITHLKKIVKFSTIEGQRHLDLSVAVAHERPTMQKALVIVKNEVEKGTLTDLELKNRLGID